MALQKEELLKKQLDIENNMKKIEEQKAAKAVQVKLQKELELKKK